MSIYNSSGAEKSRSIEKKVLLVVPPFHAIRTPALGVSQLKGNLQANDIPCEVLYLNMFFADRITPLTYELLLGTGNLLLGEFIFSYTLFNRNDADIRCYVDEVLAGSDYGKNFARFSPDRSLLDIVRSLIKEAADFVRTDAIQEILKREPWMVGFSSTFESNCASLAIMRELKKHRPEIITVIGGANCEGEMGEEIIMRIPEIDFVGQGECDLTFVSLVQSLRGKGTGTGIDGFLAKGENRPAIYSKPLTSEELDALPYPEFTDYFSQLAMFTYCSQIQPGLAMETSRGCWWGIKHHCTFCAFNRLGMVYRSKSPNRVFEEMSAHVKKYDIQRMELTDNILDMAYFRTLLQQLAKQPQAEMFWETKANLSKEQLKLMKRAKVTWIQPGIESLSEVALELMRKGTSQLQNIQLLKWCAEAGIRVTWNWLTGFPGENEAEFGELANTIQLLHHLEPPGCAVIIFLQRFAPYQMTPEKWELKGIRPALAYSHVYPFPDESLERLAFFFDCDSFDEKKNSDSLKRLQKNVGQWQAAYQNSHLLAISKDKYLVLLDTRPIAKRFYHRLRGLKRKIYEYCSEIHTRGKIIKNFKTEATPEAVSIILESLISDALLLEHKGQYLSLATVANADYRDFPGIFPGGQMIFPEASANGSSNGKLRRRLFELVSLKLPPREIAGAMKYKVTKTIIRKILVSMKSNSLKKGHTESNGAAFSPEQKKEFAQD